MTVMIGEFSLAMAMLAAAGALLAALASIRLEMPAALKVARWMIGALAGLMLLASGALLTALLQGDFSISYVTEYTEKALPVGYKIAAFWAGQEGSLLLWSLMIAVMSALHVFNRRDQQGTEGATVVAVLAVVCGFFAALMLFAANPFALAEHVLADGQGLNPLLQDPAMIAHPPLLFLGYAGYTIPFAMMVGALVSGRKDNNWVAETRRWSVVSWLFLSIGILLGAQWAYLELGWGGYWGWDPVENASLLPWLTGTALVHSIMVQQQRGMLKLWNALLFSITFILCLFGTYLTRSGIIQSVHGFAPSMIATFFLVLILATTVFSLMLILVRRHQLQSEHQLESLVGREGMFLATNVLLTGIMVVVLIGTIFPVISNALSGQEVTVGASFYNKVIAPFGLLLAAMMAMGPALVMGTDAARKLVRAMIVPVIFGLLTAVAIYLTGIKNGWALLCAAITGTLIVSYLINLVKQVALRIQAGENPLAAFVHLLDGNHRRYGGQTIHIGMMMMIVGITGSGLFVEKQDLSIKEGQSAQIAGYDVKYEKLIERRGPNYKAVQATIVVTDPKGGVQTLYPETQFFDKTTQPHSQIALESNARRDLYINLSAWEANGAVVAMQVIINPLVSWIWVGGIVLSVGGLISLLPRLLPLPASEQVEPTVPKPQPAKSKKRGTAVA